MRRIKTALLCCCIVFTGCSSWIYRIDVPQGNYIEQKQIDKLRVEMNREQILFILGSPVATNAFSDNDWHYLFLVNRNRLADQRIEVIVHFENDKVTGITPGTFTLPEAFNTPLEK